MFVHMLKQTNSGSQVGCAASSGEGRCLKGESSLSYRKVCEEPPFVLHFMVCCSHVGSSSMHLMAFESLSKCFPNLNYGLPVRPYFSVSNGSATIGTQCYYITGDHHGNKFSSQPLLRPDTELVTIQDNTSYKKASWNGTASNKWPRAKDFMLEIKSREHKHSNLGNGAISLYLFFS